MPFILKKTHVVFSRIVVKEFQEYMCKTMEVYIDDWTIYNLLRHHMQYFHLMLECCQQIQLSLKIEKCIYAKPIGTLLGHVICKDGMKIDLARIKVTLNLKPPPTQNKSRYS